MIPYTKLSYDRVTMIEFAELSGEVPINGGYLTDATGVNYYFPMPYENCQQFNDLIGFGCRHCYICILKNNDPTPYLINVDYFSVHRLSFRRYLPMRKNNITFHIPDRNFNLFYVGNSYHWGVTRLYPSKTPHQLTDEQRYVMIQRPSTNEVLPSLLKGYNLKAYVDLLDDCWYRIEKRLPFDCPEFEVRKTPA